MPALTIPLVDFSAFLQGDKQARAATAADIDRAFQNAGFVYLTKHGISPDTIAEAFTWAEKFHNLPEDIKAAVARPAGNTLDRGWNKIGQEKFFRPGESEATGQDWKESFDVGVPGTQQQPNLWPPEETLPGFQAFTESFFNQCQTLLQQILDALTLSLGLQPGDVDLAQAHEQASSQLRLQHYPPLAKRFIEEGSHQRISAHSDWGTLTLLFQDDVGGLEVESVSQSGHFDPVQSIPGSVVVNVGDLLERWSNGRWRATIHRVMTPPELLEKSNGASNGSAGRNSNGERHSDKDQEDMLPRRFSIPFFGFPDGHINVEALPGTWSESKPKKYNPINAFEYFTERVQIAYDS